MPPKPTPQEPISAIASFLKKAGEYKEFVTLVVFFLGGIFWAFAYFATKQQVQQIRCLMNANMTFLQGRMDSASLSQLMVENLKESSVLERAALNPDKSSVSSDDVGKRSQLRVAGTEIARKLVEAEQLTAQALNRLRTGDCTGQ